jgi:hypothetical protein
MALKSSPPLSSWSERKVWVLVRGFEEPDNYFMSVTLYCIRLENEVAD